ncbi:ceramide kinase-like protein [Mya arenaria]|uniref:ceramide kinase-like protein n=1 Tax=Mya arenaria TaxID=6604 RepID=UPI0022E23446|nr:ceramide kinase-like protein [Mya arenaria]
MGDIEEYIFDDDGNPILNCPNLPQEDQLFADEPDLKDIFHCKSDGYDVTLSLSKGYICWTNVNSAGKKKGKNKKGEDKNTVKLRDVFGITMKRKKASSEKEEGLCLGFTLHIADRFGPNTWVDKIVVFEHPSETLCTRYIRKTREYLDALQCRPRSVKLFLQTHAGSKTASALYKNKVLPLFQAADIDVDCIEVQHNEHIKQEMTHINLDDFDCIIAMGGDGTANKAADGLLTASQKYRGVDQKPGFTPVRARLPLGIIPCGSTNDICRSITGTEDVVTCTIHILMGWKSPVDICSAYSEDNFLQWSFNCQYGFAGNVLTFRKRYKKLGKRGLEAAFMKALTKAKLRPYKCDIEYIPSDLQIPPHRKNLPCYTGCDTCWKETVEDDNGVTEDLVQAFDPLSESNNSDTLVNLAELEETPWRTKKLDCLNIGLYTISGRSELAARGLSMYTHLNDGAAELVLIKDAPRKEFIRVLKRLTNGKEQFDFPFIEVLRVKEFKFRLRLPTGFQYKDRNFSELDYEINRQQKQMDSATKSMEILEIDDLIESDNDDQVDKSPSPSLNDSVHSKDSKRVNNNNKPAPFKKAKSVQHFDKKVLKRTSTETSIETFTTDDTDSDSDTEDSDSDMENGKEIVSVDSMGVRTVKSASAANQHLVGPAYRKTFAEEDRAKRQRKRQKKEDKKKAKEEQKMKSVWNMDNEICQEDTLHVKVHHGLLKIFGQGVSPSTIYSSPSLLCIARM